MSRPEMDFESYYRGLMESWFLSEPLLFDVMCAHSLVRNERMTCNLRIGEQRLEYNPLRLGGKSGSELETLVEIEAVRVLLKHPYQREARRHAYSQRPYYLRALSQAQQKHVYSR